MSVQGQPQHQPMLMDPSQMAGQPQQQMVTEPQTPDASQAQYDYYSQFQMQPQGQQQQQVSQQPQPLHGTPFYSPEAMADGYKNIQRQYTETNQQLRDLQSRYEQVVQHMLTQQSQPQQQQAIITSNEPKPWELPIDQFTEKFNANPTGILNQLRNDIASTVEQKAQQLISPLQQQLQGTQMYINRQAVENTYNNLHSQYGHLPNYDQFLTSAVQKITTDPVWVQSAQQNPAQALMTAFQAELGTNLGNPQFIEQLSKNLTQQAQSRQMQMQYAAPMTTSSNPQAMPHQPIMQQQMVNGQIPAQQPNNLLAHQIASYKNQEYFNPKGPQYKVVMNDFDF